MELFWVFYLSMNTLNINTALALFLFMMEMIWELNYIASLAYCFDY